MDIKNQQGDPVAKQKNVQSNSRKAMQQQINELGTLMSMCVQKINHQEQLISSVEGLVIKLSEFFNKKKDFEAYLENWIKEETEKAKQEAKERLEETVHTPEVKK